MYLHKYKIVQPVSLIALRPKDGDYIRFNTKNLLRGAYKCRKQSVHTPLAQIYDSGIYFISNTENNRRTRLLTTGNTYQDITNAIALCIKKKLFNLHPKALTLYFH